MRGERQSHTDQQGEIAEGGRAVSRLGRLRPSQGGASAWSTTQQGLLCPATLPLPPARDRLGISAPCPEETLFSRAGWVTARCGQRWLWESSKHDLRFHTASLQPRQPGWALKKILCFLHQDRGFLMKFCVQPLLLACHCLLSLQPLLVCV